MHKLEKTGAEQVIILSDLINLSPGSFQVIQMIVAPCQTHMQHIAVMSKPIRISLNILLKYLTNLNLQLSLGNNACHRFPW